MNADARIPRVSVQSSAARGGVVRFVRARGEASAVVGLVVATVVFGLLNTGGAVPLPIYLLGLVGGATVALHAIGIVLVYRANRVINFAQIQMGVTAALVFVRLAAHRTFVRVVGAVCPPCLPKPRTFGDFLAASGGGEMQELLRDPAFRAAFPPETPLTDQRLLDYFPGGVPVNELAVRSAPGWLVTFNYVIALVIALALATVLLWLVYVLVIRRFAQAPKLVLTVITIAAGFFITQAVEPLLDAVLPAKDVSATELSNATRLPVDLSFRIRPITFSAADVITVLVALAAAAGLVVFLRRSRVGIVLRGASENPDRAETLGVNVAAVTARAWLLAGALSGVAAFLTVARTGAAPAAGGYDVFVRTLAAAVAGGLVALPLSVAAAFAVGVADQVAAWVFGSQAVLGALLLGVIVLLLLAQRARAGRAEREAGASWHASRELRPIPPQLRQLPTVRTTIRFAVAIGSVVALGYPWFMSPSQTTTGVVTMVYAMVGLSLLVLTGWAGQISLGQMAFAAVGAWVAAVSGLPFLLSVPVGATVGMLLAVAVGIPSLKLRGLHLAITTLALGVATVSVLFDERLLGRFVPRSLDRPMLLGIDFEGDRAFFYLTLSLLAAAVLATMGLRRSVVARALIAAKDNEQAAMGFGINLLRARVAAFAVSGFIASAAGVMFAYAQHGIEPLAFGPDAGISVFLMTLIGGLGSVAGPLVGALYLGTLRILADSELRSLARILLNPGLGVILVLVFMPGGVVQGLYSIRDAWLRRVAARNRISVPSLATGRDAAGGIVPIQPNLRPSGGQLFVPERFRMEGQWVVRARRAAQDKARDAANA